MLFMVDCLVCWLLGPGYSSYVRWAISTGTVFHRPVRELARITAPLGHAAARARLGPTALFFLSYFCWSEARCASLYGSVAAAAARRARRDTLVLLVGLLTLGHYILTSEGQTLGL